MLIFRRSCALQPPDQDSTIASINPIIHPQAQFPPMTVDPSLSEENYSATLEAAAGSARVETVRIARAASIISLGNIASRVLGLIRETVTSHLFGAGAVVDAFGLATIIPTMLYDLLIGGMINSSLVPVFSEYASDRKEDLWRLVSVLLTLTVLVMSVFIILVELFAPQVALLLLSSQRSAANLELAANLLRITVPAVLFLSLSGVLSGLLYALKRFSYPAFTAAVFNAGIILVTLLFHRQLGIAAMALGLLFGAVAQVALQLPGLRDAGLKFTFAFRSTGLKRVTALYTPIALGLIVDILVGRIFLYNLAARSGEGGISWMRYATYLIQLPQGLVAIAVSFATLPTLTSYAVGEVGGDPAQRESFRATLAQGLKLVTVLIIPATVGLFLLAHPTIELLFEGGAFTPLDTDMTAMALRLYLLGLPFAALDLLLVFAFYARQNTLTPSLIGVATVLASLAVAFALHPVIGLFSVMVAESFKLLLHAAIAAYILRRQIGGLRQYGVLRTIGLSLIGASGMGFATYGLLMLVETVLPIGPLREVLAVAVPGMLGAGVYLGLIALLRVEEMHLLIGAIRRRFGNH